MPEAPDKKAPPSDMLTRCRASWKKKRRNFR